MKKLKVLLDIDEVLCEWTKEVLFYHNQRYPNDQFKPIEDWGFYGSFYHCEDMKLAFSTTSAEGGYLDKVLKYAKPTSWNRAGYQLLCNAYDVTLATNRVLRTDMDVEAITLQWLYRNSFTEHNGVIFTDDKSLLEGDILIDDKPSNLDAFIKTGRLGICMMRDWNKNYYGMVAQDLTEAYQNCKTIQKLRFTNVKE